MDRNPNALGISEAAAFIGAHEQTVRKLARSGAIPAYRVGTVWRFRKEALVRWMEGQQRGRSGCSVLVIDDDERICKALARIVEQFGCRVRQAPNGQRGLELVAEAVPDLILLDLIMPAMNGPQFLRALRKTQPDLPVVVVTGYPDSALMKEAAQYAPLMVAPKPVDQALLERTMRVALGKRSTAGVE
ncbi:MAG: response regulator [Deltaproteobacteria bacterium]|nr:response regulator [Deltaproteobacteria bacterium]